MALTLENLEETALGIAGCVRLRDAGQYAGVLAGQHFVAVVIAAVRQHGDFRAPGRIAGLADIRA